MSTPCWWRSSVKSRYSSGAPALSKHRRNTPFVNRQEPAGIGAPPATSRMGWARCGPFNCQNQADVTNHANGTDRIGKYAVGGAGDAGAVLSRPAERSSTVLAVNEADQTKYGQRVRCWVLKGVRAAIAQRGMAPTNAARISARRDAWVCSVQ